MRPGWTIRWDGRVDGHGRRWLTRAVLIAVAVVPTTIVVGSATASPAGASVHRDGSQPGGPILECSYKDPKTLKYNTLWGYENDTGQSYTVPVGTYNTFSSPAANAGQPTTFLAGRHDNVFIVTSTGSSAWTLGYVTVTAPGTACAKNPVPFLPSGVPAWVTIGALMAVVLAGGLLVQSRVERAATR
jgi:hypothetical protein